MCVRRIMCSHMCACVCAPMCVCACVHVKISFAKVCAQPLLCDWRRVVNALSTIIEWRYFAIARRFTDVATF